MVLSTSSYPELLYSTTGLKFWQYMIVTEDSCRLVMVVLDTSEYRVHIYADRLQCRGWSSSGSFASLVFRTRVESRKQVLLRNLRKRKNMNNWEERKLLDAFEGDMEVMLIICLIPDFVRNYATYLTELYLRTYSYVRLYTKFLVNLT